MDAVTSANHARFSNFCQVVLSLVSSSNPFHSSLLRSATQYNATKTAYVTIHTRKPGDVTRAITAV